MVTITILRYFQTLSFDDVDLGRYVQFLEENSNFLNLCQIFQCQLALIYGEITYTSNMYKIDSLIITSKLFSENYFWLILKYIKYGQ